MTNRVRVHTSVSKADWSAIMVQGGGSWGGRTASEGAEPQLSAFHTHQHEGEPGDLFVSAAVWETEVREGVSGVSWREVTSPGIVKAFNMSVSDTRGNVSAC